ncbi:hypothetical protein K504DRAFT_453396 [Pleomassaria siparia CBS 279.74]|uniref:Uncharacterized protein n=1 Tax=Pleomassaria siparia CBS 279.74 TaxID=1314801 RepID=A0A6G1KFM4_9PLEO|nr:hypothetical protein K504DRAFT_453396 [Pleomassaria siparia CBS 279.74]
MSRRRCGSTRLKSDLIFECIDTHLSSPRANPRPENSMPIDSKYLKNILPDGISYTPGAPDLNSSGPANMTNDPNKPPQIPKIYVTYKECCKWPWTITQASVRSMVHNWRGCPDCKDVSGVSMASTSTSFLFSSQIPLRTLGNGNRAGANRAEANRAEANQAPSNAGANNSTLG